MRSKLSLLLLLFATCTGPTALAADESATPALALVPSEAVLVVQIPKPKVLIDRAFDAQVQAAVKKLPFYDQVWSSPEAKQAWNLVEYFRTKHDTDLATMIDGLVGGGITFAVGPKGEALLIVDAKDEAFLNEVHDFFKMTAQGDATKQGDPGRVTSADYRGVTGWKFGPNEVHAIIGNRLVLSNKAEVLKAVIDIKEAGAGALVDSTAYHQATKAVGPEAAIVAYANMDVLKHTPDLAKALNATAEPFGMLLLAPVQAALRDAKWLAAGVQVKGDAVTLKMVTDGSADDPNSPRGFATPPTSTAGALPNLDVPRRIAAFSFYRDLHGFYAAKDELFPERTSGIIFFENMMGIFFTGRDLTEEVLAETYPEVRVVVARQQYDAKTGIPALQFPSFAIVMRMRDPVKFAPIVEEAWQKAIGLVNFTRGQQALAGLIIDRPEYHGIKYTMAYFSVAGESDPSKADVRFNFQPSLAFQGANLILSSTRGLTETLIDALKKEEAEQVWAVAAQHTLGVLDGGELAAILDANREALIRQNMVEDGHTRAEAEAQIEIILTIARHIHSLVVDAGASEGQSEVTLKVGYDLP